jgi:hypothetical protein
MLYCEDRWRPKYENDDFQAEYGISLAEWQNTNQWELSGIVEDWWRGLTAEEQLKHLINVQSRLETNLASVSQTIREMHAD